MTPEERKHRTEQILQDKGIPFLDSLPLTEDENDVELRATEDVGKRIVCLFCFAGTGFNPDNRNFINYLKENDVWEFLSEEEATLLSNPNGHEKALINASWRMEALYFLLWATGVIKDLPWPTEESSSSDFMEAMPAADEPPWPFIRSLVLRPVSEIMDASDLIYRLHWAARTYGNEIPINQGVVQEWHHAVNWLTNYDGEKWDWVATDT